MSSGSDPSAEVRSLADAMFDGTIDARDVGRLEELMQDPSHLQAYLEMVNLHGALLHQADQQSDEQAALAVLRDFTLACERRDRRKNRNNNVLLATAAMLLCGVVGWMFSGDFLRPTPLASISMMTSDASLHSGKADLGHVVRKGQSFSVKEGIVSLQMEHAIIDLIGPAELKLNGPARLQLLQGTLNARVLPGGEGFTVHTPDGEIVDKGTEFLVQYDPQTGTEISVRRGRAVTSLLDGQGIPTQSLELTTSRSARIRSTQTLIEETIFREHAFTRVDRARGTIRSLSGQLRTMEESPATLASEQTETPNHLLVIQERQHVKLNSDLAINSVSGNTVIPAGTRVSSYLVHYDPTTRASYAPRGTITFFGQIQAAIVDAGELVATDALFGLSSTLYEQRPSRGLERNADEVRISEDRQAVSFFFGMAPPEYLDEVRILVVDEPALQPGQ